MFASKDLFFTKPSGAGYQISRSVRLRSSASAYFNRTPASATNRKTWTWSSWVKRGKLGADQYFFSANVDPSLTTLLRFTSSDVIRLYTYAGGATQTFDTTAVFRDPSAWYHVVAIHDTTQATAADRLQVWVNGVRQAGTTTGTVSQNSDGYVNAAVLHDIGQWTNGGSVYLDGYITEINFVDGQALTPSSFGQTNSVTGVWQPIKYGGTYGTNGFYLNFSDNSAATAAAIGKDSSGNGNNWTPNNISVTAGVTYDSMLDVPTVSATSSNYAVMNPLDLGGGQTTTNANLTVNYTSGSWTYGRASFWVSSSKWYWEITITAITNGGLALGIGNESSLKTGSGNNDPNFWFYNALTGVLNSNTTNPTSVASSTTNDIVSFAFDVGGATLAVYKNNSLLYTFTGITGSLFTVITGQSTSIGGNCAFNFGQRPFSYTPPTGFVALNTQNLPTPTISNGATVMAATTYTGTGATQTIANSGNNAGSISFKPDLVWIKSRSAATDHKLTDSVRGTTKALISDTSGAETTDTNGLTAFGTTGFTIGSDTVYNNNTATYVAWQWQAGQGSTSSNTSGSITSTVSVNATAGFSVATFTKNASTNETIGHGLGVAPKMIIVKTRGSTGYVNWAVWHTSIGIGNYIELNTTVASQASTTIWNNTLPTSTVFSMGTAWTAASNSMVAYCFAAVAGYSAFGSYTGNGSADGPFVYLGFRLRWLMIKRSSAASVTYGWQMYDTSRQTYNSSSDPNLWADTSAAEGTGNYTFDLLSNGFKLRSSGVNENANGDTYIYAAFAESPFKLALAR